MSKKLLDHSPISRWWMYITPCSDKLQNSVITQVPPSSAPGSIIGRDFGPLWEMVQYSSVIFTRPSVCVMASHNAGQSVNDVSTIVPPHCLRKRLHLSLRRQRFSLHVFHLSLSESADAEFMNTPLEPHQGLCIFLAWNIFYLFCLWKKFASSYLCNNASCFDIKPASSSSHILKDIILGLCFGRLSPPAQPRSFRKVPIMMLTRFTRSDPSVLKGYSCLYQKDSALCGPWGRLACMDTWRPVCTDRLI